MNIEVKICGLREPAAVEAALAGGAAYLGFVFYPPSPRSLSVEAAAALAEPARGRARIVALTVDADDALVREIAAVLKPDVMQLHGSETPERVREIARISGARVMKAVKIGGRDDIEAARRYSEAADMLLFDAKPRPGEGLGLPGGNGVTFDWRLVRGLDLGKPVMLSGGLDAENVALAVELSGVTAVDVSSGVETAPGIKDARLIGSFLDAVHAIEGVSA